MNVCVLAHHKYKRQTMLRFPTRLPNPTEEGIAYAALSAEEKRRRWDLASASLADSAPARELLMRLRVMSSIVPELDIYKKDDGVLYNTDVVPEVDSGRLMVEWTAAERDVENWYALYPELFVEPRRIEQETRRNVARVSENPNLGRWIFMGSNIGQLQEEELFKYLDVFAPLLRRVERITMQSETWILDRALQKTLWKWFIENAPNLSVIDLTIVFENSPAHRDDVLHFSHQMIARCGREIRVVVDTDVIHDDVDDDVKYIVARTQIAEDNRLRPFRIGDAAAQLLLRSGGLTSRVARYPGGVMEKTLGFLLS